MKGVAVEINFLEIRMLDFSLHKLMVAQRQRGIQTSVNLMGKSSTKGSTNFCKFDGQIFTHPIGEMITNEVYEETN